MNKKVSIIKSNSGNIFNVAKAFQYIGAEVELISTNKDITNSDYLIFPGVGSFSEGMAALEDYDLIYAIKQWVDKGRPLLGICLGMQLLFESSEEFGFNKGLGLVEGEVKLLPKNLNLKVPNISWQRLYYKLSNSKSYDHEKLILKNHDINKDLYFVHSYACYPKLEENCLATSKYGNHNFCSIVNKNNIYGFQFHPEKSGNAGLKLLQEFLKV